VVLQLGDCVRGWKLLTVKTACYEISHRASNLDWGHWRALFNTAM